tara:strand:- start:177 stop:446 length:270 start_codon:yes stop_codon:yes gene_type:complete
MDILNDKNAVVLQGLLHERVKHHILRIEAKTDRYRFVLKNKTYVDMSREILSSHEVSLEQITETLSTQILKQAHHNVVVADFVNKVYYV